MQHTVSFRIQHTTEGGTNRIHPAFIISLSLFLLGEVFGRPTFQILHRGFPSSFASIIRTDKKLFGIRSSFAKSRSLSPESYQSEAKDLRHIVRACPEDVRVWLGLTGSDEQKRAWQPEKAPMPEIGAL
jgi:hypothetical protein